MKQNLYMIYTPYSLLTSLLEAISNENTQHHILYFRKPNRINAINIGEIAREIYSNRDIKITVLPAGSPLNRLIYTVKYIQDNLDHRKINKIYVVETCFIESLVAVEYFIPFNLLHQSPNVILIEEGTSMYFDVYVKNNVYTDECRNLEARRVKEVKAFFPDLVKENFKSVKVSQLNIDIFKSVLKDIYSYMLKNKILDKDTEKTIKESEVILLLTSLPYLYSCGVESAYIKNLSDYMDYLKSKGIKFMAKHHPDDADNPFLEETKRYNIHHMPFELIAYINENMKILFNQSTISTALYTPKLLGKNYRVILENYIQDFTFEELNLNKLRSMGVDFSIIKSLREFKSIIRNEL